MKKYLGAAVIIFILFTINACNKSFVPTGAAQDTPGPQATATDTPVLATTSTETETVLPGSTATETATETSIAATATETTTPGATGVFVTVAMAGQTKMDFMGSPMLMTVASVNLKIGDALGTSITGATVAAEGQGLTESSPGEYAYMNMTGFDYSAGQVIDLSVTSSEGNCSASATLPPIPSAVSPLEGATPSASSTITITWTYTGGTPTNVALVVQETVSGTVLLNTTLPGSQTSYVFAPGYFTPGTQITYAVTTIATGTITGANAGSTLFMVQSSEVVNFTPQ